MKGILHVKHLVRREHFDSSCCHCKVKVMLCRKGEKDATERSSIVHSLDKCAWLFFTHLLPYTKVVSKRSDESKFKSTKKVGIHAPA